jgi:hypothetical protein
MSEKGFIKWLRRFLEKTDIKELQINNSRKFHALYNHTTALKEINNKLEEIKNV